MKFVMSLISLIDASLDMWENHRIRKQIRRDEALRQRLANLQAREKSNEIDDQPTPGDKHDILGGM
jgi:hypothetical protein